MIPFPRRQRGTRLRSGVRVGDRRRPQGARSTSSRSAHCGDRTGCRPAALHPKCRRLPSPRRPCRRHRRVAAPWHCDRPSGSLLSDRQRRPLRLASGLGPQAPRLRRPRLRLRTGQQLSPRCSYVEASPPPDVNPCEPASPMPQEFPPGVLGMCWFVGQEERVAWGPGSDLDGLDK